MRNNTQIKKKYSIENEQKNLTKASPKRATKKGVSQTSTDFSKKKKQKDVLKQKKKNQNN